MLRFQMVCAQMIEFLYYCRAKFAFLAVNGIGLSIFNNLTTQIKRKRTLSYDFN
ncbi:RAxF-45 family protein [Gottfriedia sp. NPDC057991]|uniref:RAxF-45 family protein n=1 Tax=Bacillaceae TaxID=186817 RepID=UPI00267B14E8